VNALSGLFIVTTLLLAMFAGCAEQQEPKRRSERPPDVHPLEAMKESDCFSCHGITETSIGPSYTRIARRYQGLPGVRSTLVGKVMEGGGGIWGSAQMSRHPFLKEEEVSRMVDWVMATHARDSLLHAWYAATETPPIGPIGPFRLRLFLPSNDDLLAPPHYESRTTALQFAGADIAHLSTLPAYVVIDGALPISTDGKYFFRIKGALTGQFTIDDQIVITVLESDQETLIHLTAGAHPFRLELPVRSPDDLLALEWIPPDSLFYGPMVSPWPWND
jgi:cytochrome c551/c552